MNRHARARTQRILLIDAAALEDHIEYSVLGAHDDVYAVQQAPHGWSCSCPDARCRHAVCKHICFVQDRVLHGQSDYAAARQRLGTDLPRERELWAPGALEAHDKRAAPSACPVCREPIDVDESVFWCGSGCGCTTHAACWRRWRTARGSLCPVCRVKITL